MRGGSSSTLKLRNWGIGLAAGWLALGCTLPGADEGGSDPGPEGTGDWRTDGPEDSAGPQDGYPGPGGCPDCGMPRAQRLRLDLSSAVGLAIMGQGEGASGAALPPTLGGSLSALPSADGLTAMRGEGLAAGLASSPLGTLQLAGGDGEGGGGDMLPPAEEPPPEGGEPGEGEGEGDAALYKLGEDGTMQPALMPLESEQAPEQPEAEPDPNPDGSDPGEFAPGDVKPPDPGQVYVPRVLALGMSPDASVYVLFEHSFQYRDVEEGDTETDVWAPQSPYTCQLFRSPVNIDPESPDFNPAADLQCVTNQHELPTWRTDRLMQFDKEGRLYFPAMVPGGGREIFYVYDPTTGSLDEKVNGNICWHDVEVTPRGSVFYTGTSSSGGDCSGTSFFRYISADNRLTEIARDWWDFKYLAEQDPEDPDTERIIFYGPDPRATGDDPWSSACLYRYDPAISEPNDRVSELTTCAMDGWQYVYGEGGNYPQQEQTPEERSAMAERCESEGQIFVSGQGVSELAQMKDGTIFVAGDFQRKLAGVATCDLEVSVSHCDNLDPSITTAEDCGVAGGSWVDLDGGECSDLAYSDESSCVGAGHDWFSNAFNQWYSQQSGIACTGGEGWHTQVTCQGEGQYGNFSENISGLAFLDPKSESQSLVLLSDPGEEVESFWTLDTASGPEFYYSVYQAGTYSLQRALVENGQVVRQTVLVDYEVYNVSRDPAHPGRVLFDGLNFSQNAYQFGSVDPNLSTPEEVEASIEVVSGVTGRIETLVILPDF